MKTVNFPTTACRVCRFYQPEGRRGGTCEQLGVPVRASWKACSLALPPFTSSWEKMEAIWQDDNQLIEALSAKSSLGSSVPDSAQEALPSNCSQEKLTLERVFV